MSFTDDHSPQANQPQSGSETGDIFNTSSDMISGSPTTTERVVDTQSGYLVVIKKVDTSRVGLSVKRRIGTPPGTSILLTPDEQVKLSKILADARSLTPATRVSPKAENWKSTLSSKTRSGYDELSLDDAPEREFAKVKADREVDYALQKRRRGDKFPLNRAQLVGLVAAFLILPGIAFLGISKLFHKDKTAAAPITTTAAAPAPHFSEDNRIDKFVRAFVADMLDFNPSTYRVSQVHAMASMKPELMEKYWKETGFPLSNNQLGSSPKGQTLMITKVDLKPGADSTRDVDLYAELVSANSKVSTPVHLRLSIGYTSDDQLRVLDQKDLSGK